MSEDKYDLRRMGRLFWQKSKKAFHQQCPLLMSGQETFSEKDKVSYKIEAEMRMAAEPEAE